MGKETKFGLCVGIMFIVLFGFILSARVGSSAQEHAPLAVGKSELHQRLARSDNHRDLPFTLVVPAPTPVDERSLPAEESLPAPQGRPTDSPLPSQPAGGRVRDNGGVVVFEPAEVETPVPDRLAPSPPPTPPVLAGGPAPEPARPVHTVVSGETLTAIARRYYGKEGEGLWKQIWEANKAAVPDPHRLVAGKKLVIPQLPAERSAPVPDTAVAEQPTPAPAETPDRGGIPSVTVDDLARMLGVQSDLAEQPSKPPAMYTVRQGDTFYKIAQDLYGDGRMARLLALKNKHLVPDERKLKVGQRIVLLDGVDRVSADAAVAQR